MINRLQFGADDTSAGTDAGVTQRMRKRLGIVNPLDGIVVHPEECGWRGAEGPRLTADRCTAPQPTSCSSVGPVAQGILVRCADACSLHADFLKVVSTSFNLLNGQTVNSHQYSVTSFERDVGEGNAPGKEGHGRESGGGQAPRASADRRAARGRLYEPWHGRNARGVHQVRVGERGETTSLGP